MAECFMGWGNKGGREGSTEDHLCEQGEETCSLIAGARLILRTSQHR